MNYVKKIAWVIVLLMLFSIVVNGEQVSDYEKIPVLIDEQEERCVGYLIDDTVYVKVRDFSEKVSECTIRWEAETHSAYIILKEYTIIVPENDAIIEAKDRFLYTDCYPRIIDGALYAPVRILGKVLGAEILWNEENSTVEVSCGKIVFESADKFYDPTDLYWMSRIIHAEAGGEPFLGKVGVGTVVMNRVKSDQFPSTVYEVIFDTKHGRQFAPTAGTYIYKEPTEECVKAAKVVLEGYRLHEDIMYFMNESLAENFWIKHNRNYLFTICCHDFYA